MQIDEALEFLARNGGTVTFTPKEDGRSTLQVTSGTGKRPRRRSLTCEPDGDDPLGMLLIDAIEELADEDRGPSARKRKS